MRRLTFLLLLVFAVCVPALAVNGPSSDVVPCGLTYAGYTFCSPTPAPQGTNPRSATGTSGPYIQPTGSGISGRIMMQDEMADGIDVNTSTCASTTTFGASPTPVQSLELKYIPASMIRHFRDGFAVCYNTTAHDTYWNNFCTLDGADVIAGFFSYFPVSTLKTATSTYPCIRESEFLNEYDAYTGDNNSSLKLSTAANVGDTQIAIGGMVAAKTLVPGASYVFADGTNEAFTGAPAQAQTDLTNFQIIGSTGAGLLQAHALNAPINRNTIANDYTYVPPFYFAPGGEADTIKKYTNWKIMCPNLAQAINGYYFFNNGRTISNCEINDGHLYGQQAEIEGPLGDWSKGTTAITHGSCSYGNGTSYSFYYNRCSTAFLGGYGTENKNLYVTEYSNEVGPIGAAIPSAQSGIIPDDWASDMLVRTFVGMHNHGVKRLYWFQIIDGTSGCGSGFYSYGLIYEGPYSCTPNNTAYPQATPIPKPEFLSMMNLIDATTDANCKFPTCQFQPTAPTVTWSPAALPLQTAMTEDSQGYYNLFYWTGASGFTQPCTQTTNSNCYTTVTPISVTLSGASLAGLSSVLNYAYNDVSTNPLPGPTGVTRADGNTYNVPQKCPWPPTSTYFSCIQTPAPLTVSGSSVSLTAQKYMQWVRFLPVGQTPPPTYSVPTYAPPSPIPT